MEKYKRKIGGRKYAHFDPENLAKAIEERNKGKSLRYLEQKYGIPKSTIDNKTKGKHVRSAGGQCTLNAEEEIQLSQNIILASKWGFPLSIFDARLLVKSYLDAKGKQVKKFKQNLPGPDWAIGFLKRQKQLISQRWCQNVKRNRTAISHKMVNEYFDELGESLKDVEPRAIVNYDERILTDDPGSKKILCRRGTKHPTRVLDVSKQSYSVMFSGSADGSWLPPYIVYKAEHLYDTWTTMGPKGARYNRTKSGWFTMEVFEDWYFSILLPYFQKLSQEIPKVLIGDNLASHVSPAVIKSCVQNNIRFCLLPPNSTHITQPLDVSCFRPLKAKWRVVLTDWKIKHRGTIPKDTFPRLLKSCLDKMFEDENGKKNLIAGFEAIGVVPLNREKVLKHIPKTTEEITDECTGPMNLTFETFLRELHDKETLTTKQKKSKINVPAGKKVTNFEEPEAGLSSCPETKKLTKLLKKKRSTPVQEMDSSSDEIEEDDLPKTPDSEWVESSEEEIQETETIQYDDIKQGNFLMVELDYEAPNSRKTKKRFICQIVEKCSPHSIKCSFLRRSTKAANIYIFPNELDVTFIKVNQIVQIVKPLFERRGRFSFSYEL